MTPSESCPRTGILPGSLIWGRHRPEVDGLGHQKGWRPLGARGTGCRGYCSLPVGRPSPTRGGTSNSAFGGGTGWGSAASTLGVPRLPPLPQPTLQGSRPAPVGLSAPSRAGRDCTTGPGASCWSRSRQVRAAPNAGTESESPLRPPRTGWKDIRNGGAPRSRKRHPAPWKARHRLRLAATCRSSSPLPSVARLPGSDPQQGRLLQQKVQTLPQQVWDGTSDSALPEVST